MAQFDYYDIPTGQGYLLNVQSDLITDLNTVVVIPLLPSRSVPNALRYLHPIFPINGQPYVLVTHLLTAIPSRELSKSAGSLEPRRDEIVRALDTLLSGI